MLESRGKFTFLLMCLALPFSAQQLIAAEPSRPTWSGFQNGGRLHTVDTDLPTHWSSTENIAWKSAVVGYGQSTPIIDRDRVIVTSISGDKKEHFHVTAFRLQNGEKLWEQQFDNPTMVENNGYTSRAAPTPVTDELGYTAFCEGGLVVALDRDGGIRWQRNLVAEYGPIDARHGLASSLEQSAEHLFVWIERSKEPYLIALEKQSGRNVWKVDGLGATTWSTPRLIQVAGSPHLVCSASGRLVGFDPETGQRLWEFNEVANNTSCSPIPVSDGTFLIGASEARSESGSTNSLGSSGIVQVKPIGDGKFDVQFVWQAKKATCSFGSPVAAGDRVFVVNKAGVLYQLSANSGVELAVDRTKAGSIWATPIICGSNVYLFGQKGTTSIVSLETGKSIADNPLWASADEAADGAASSGQTIYAAAAAHGRLIIRTGTTIYAIGSP